MPNGAARQLYSNSRCYMRGLGNCSTKLSGEHIVSATVLELVSQGLGFSIEGLPGRKDSTGVLPHHQILKFAVLCKDHNSWFSHVDTDGEHFISSLIDAAKIAIGRTGLYVPFHLDGDRFERWAVKTACGIYASQQRQAKRPFEVPIEVQRYLADPRLGLVPHGLFLFPGRPFVPTAINKFSVRTITPGADPTKFPLGLEFSGAGIIIQVFISPPPDAPAWFEGAIHRPGELAYSTTQGGTVSVTIHYYPDRPSNRHIRVER